MGRVETQKSSKVLIKLILLVSIVAIVCIGWLLGPRYLPPQWLYSDKIKHCNVVIRKVEDFRKKTGKYPSNTDYSNNGIEDEGSYFYEQKDNGFRVGFSVGFDESYEYDSAKEKWSFEK